MEELEELEDSFDEFRYFNKPEVILIGGTELYYDNLVNWADRRGFNVSSDSTNPFDHVVEFNGRLCYLSFNKRRPPESGLTQNKTYIKHLLEVKHTSVLEHAVFNFLIYDVSRNFTHELVRHRVGVAYSQLSSRYVDQFDDSYFSQSEKTLGAYVPKEVAADPELMRAYDDAWRACQKAYLLIYNKQRLLGLPPKKARSIARHMLPGSAETMIGFTANANILNHIFAKRGALDADPEIRSVAVALYKVVKDINVFQKWSLISSEKDGEYLQLIS